MSIFRKKDKKKLYSPIPKIEEGEKNEKFYKKKWFLVAAGVFVLVAVGAGGFLYKTGYILNKISDSNNSALESLFGVIPGMGKEIEAEDDGRTNVLLLGMRGENIPGGGLLADTIMVVSIKADENKVALISIPRDLYVKVPGTESRSKINAVHAYGQENGKNEGLSQMKKVVSEITGLNIHYAARINFVGFKQMIDAVGGIDISLETAFYESTQFVKGNECGGQFYLPKGENHLNGETTLCYVRSRENTSDFDRAKRQQVVLKALKSKFVSLGTLTDFGKLNAILDSVGNNVLTDMSSSEMRKFYEKYASIENPDIFQRVFENSEEGLLMVPSDAPKEAGYVLIPRAGWDNYSQLHEVCKNIYTVNPQGDINPVKQYSKPQATTQEDSSSNSKDKEAEEEKEAVVPIKTTGKLSLDDGLEVDSTQLKIEEVKIKGAKSLVNETKSIKIDLDKVAKVKKAEKVKIKVESLQLPDGIKIVDPSDKTKTVMEIVVVSSEASD